jgi:hypothetical protein
MTFKNCSDVSRGVSWLVIGWLGYGERRDPLANDAEAKAILS